MLDDILSLDDYKKIDRKKLPLLAGEIRERIISVMKKNGGHLSSNLGTVELIMAVHFVFDSPSDKIIFDVGHQSYVHKILTGRNHDFDTVRLAGGISGFTRRSESVHDMTDSGHASVSISQAVGFAQAMKIAGDSHRVVAVIGDGALTGGPAFEGLNYAGHAGLPVIVILNDNEMSIGSNVGAISRYLNKLAVSKIYQNITDDIEKSIKKNRNPFRQILRVLNKMKKGVKMLFDYENIFTDLGFEYIGPIDGHNLNELLYILERVKKNVKHPVLLHVKTMKGKGFADAEGDPSKFHGVTPLMMSNGKLDIKTFDTFTDIFSRKIVAMAEGDGRVVAVTAAMEAGTGLSYFAEKFPERFFDVGIAEQHAVSFAAAMGYSGLKPFVAIYSTFLSRAVDQIIQDVCISSSPVVFVVDRAGLVGADGETHHGQFDTAYLSMIPGICLLSPFDGNDLELALEYSLSYNAPVALRYPKDSAVSNYKLSSYPNYEEKKFIVERSGSDVLFVVIGNFIDLVCEAASLSGLDCGIILLRFIKPLPIDELILEMEKYKMVVVIEEAVFSGSVSEKLFSYKGANNSLKYSIKSVNLPESFISHGTRKDLLVKSGFSVDNILNIIKSHAENII